MTDNPSTTIPPHKLTIIGGGITGLAAAYMAAKAGWQVTVLESGSKMGGLLNTFSVAGNRLEYYYHHFFTHDAEIAWLLAELGLTNAIEYNRGTMGIFRDGKLFNWNGPLDVLSYSPMGILDKLRFGISSLYLGKLAAWQRWEDIPAMDWFYKYAGKTATATLWRPMLEVKFGPFAKDVPVAWMVGRLRQRMNSRQGQDEYLGYLKGSLQTLLDKLLEKLPAMGVKLYTNTPVEKFNIEHNRLSSVETPSGAFSQCLFLATIPTIYLAPLLQRAAPAYAEKLAQVEYFGAVCTVLELDRPLSHIYWLNVADPGFPFGGVIEHTNLIPPTAYNDSHLVYLSRYFAHQDPLASMPAAEIEAMMLAPLARIYPEFKRAWLKNVFVFKTLTAATVCDLNFSQKVPRAVSPIEHLYLATMSHIYPDERSVNNSVRVAAQVCRLLGIDTSMVPSNASLAGKIGME